MTLQFIDVKDSTTAELFTRGCETAAAILRETAGQSLGLAVTRFDVLTLETRLAACEIGERVALVGASQEFAGDLAGQALVLFEAEAGLRCVRALLQQHPEPEFMTEIDQSALTEIANIIINACLDDLAKGVRGDVTSGVPTALRGDRATILQGLQEPAAEAVTLAVQLALTLPQAEIKTELLFLTAAEGFAEFWRAAVRDIRIPVPLHG